VALLTYFNHGIPVSIGHQIDCSQKSFVDFALKLIISNEAAGATRQRRAKISFHSFNKLIKI
jgi:hypothetical protein